MGCFLCVFVIFLLNTMHLMQNNRDLSKHCLFLEMGSDLVRPVMRWPGKVWSGPESGLGFVLSVVPLCSVLRMGAVVLQGFLSACPSPLLLSFPGATCLRAASLTHAFRLPQWCTVVAWCLACVRLVEGTEGFLLFLV